MGLLKTLLLGGMGKMGLKEALQKGSPRSPFSKMLSAYDTAKKSRKQKSYLERMKKGRRKFDQSRTHRYSY